MEIRVNILLALDYENVARALKQFGQSIRNASHTIQLPYPASFAVWPSLQELLIRKPHHLIEQCAALIAVVEYILSRLAIGCRRLRAKPLSEVARRSANVTSVAEPKPVSPVY